MPSDSTDPSALDPVSRGVDGVDGPLCETLLQEIREQGMARLEREPPLPIGFCKALGMRMLALGDGETFLATPHLPELVGDPETGVIHGGVVTTLLDTAAGVAVSAVKGTRTPGIVTLDLRIDYMRPAEPGKVIMAKARVFRRARQITFVRGVAFDDTEASPIAIATGAFMNGGKTSDAKPADAKPKPEADQGGAR